jgi:hypothetical protein
VVLVALQREGVPTQEALPVASTLAGRCFRDLRLLDTDQGRQVWVPLLDGLERLGAVHLEFDAAEDRPEDEQLQQFASLTAEITLANENYEDLFHVTRRRQPMSLAAHRLAGDRPPKAQGRRAANPPGVRPTCLAAG